MTTAKTIQFAKMSGLSLCGEEDGEPQWLGAEWQHLQLRVLQAKDDRGEFYQNYPWKFPF